MSVTFIPEKFKLPNVYPKYKIVLKIDANSYRPIFLIPNFSKIIKKIALLRHIKQLQENFLLTKQQHGFIKGRSRFTTIIQFIEYIIDKVEEGCKITSLFLDFSKAFDCRDHVLLIRKSKTLGITW